MVPAWTIKSIYSALGSNAGRKNYEQIETKDTQLQNILSGNIDLNQQRIDVTFGVLFACPELPLFRTEIAPHLNYLHHASGKHIDFFCAGYGAFWPQDTPPYKDARVIREINQPGWPSNGWLYSDQAFVNLYRSFESQSKWQYKDGTTLLLLSAQLQTSGDVRLDFSETLSVRFEDAIRDKAVESVHGFIHSIIVMAERQQADTWNMSDRLGVKAVLQSVAKELIPKVPFGLGIAAQRASHFAVEDFTAA